MEKMYLLATFTPKGIKRFDIKDTFPLVVTSGQKERLWALEDYRKNFIGEAFKRFREKFPDMVDKYKNHTFSVLKPEGENHKRFLRSLSGFSHSDIQSMGLDLTDIKIPQTQ